MTSREDVEVGGFLQARGIPEESRGKQTMILIEFLPRNVNGRPDCMRVQIPSKRVCLGFREISLNLP